jgi:hypothetical protein
MIDLGGFPPAPERSNLIVLLQLHQRDYLPRVCLQILIFPTCLLVERLAIQLLWNRNVIE